MGKNETVESEPLRYLLLSNGREIHCLDLHARRFLSSSIFGNTQLLPIIATLNLVEENLPTPVGLFKWRSNALLFGGRKLTKALEEEEDRLYTDRVGENLYHTLFMTDRVKHTPCLIYGLSLDDAKTSLSYSKSSMGKLKKSKRFPIVEEINGKIHVIDNKAVCLDSRDYGISTHEVLDRDSGCRVEEIPMLENFHINYYLVIGQKVYAASIDEGVITCMVFDSKKKKWDVANSRAQWEHGQWEHDGPMFRDVWDILQKLQVVSFVGGFPYGDVRDPLYVLIAVDSGVCDNSIEGTTTLAFLVNLSGLILCIQPLIHFFKCVQYIFEGKIIKVEEDKLGKKTMCCVVNGFPWDTDAFARIDTCVSINIFSVEELPDAAEKVRQFEAKGSDSVEVEFVRVDVMDKHVYRVEAIVGGGNSRYWSELQACFL